MVLSVQVQGHKATAMLDFGASCNIINAGFAAALKSEVQPRREVVHVRLADGRVVNHMGCATLDIDIQGVGITNIRCLTLDLKMDWDVLLGTPSSKTFLASLAYEDSTVRGYTRKDKPFVLRCPRWEET